MSTPIFDRLCKRLQPGPNGCLEFQGYRARSGYGIIGLGTKKLKVHRVAWEGAFGPIPDDLCVLHSCDNRVCCNSEHLFLGTRLDNAIDREKKGRGNHQTGKYNGNAKLTREKAEAIRADTRLHREIAADYGVSRSTITTIKTGAAWVFP